VPNALPYFFLAVFFFALFFLAGIRIHLLPIGFGFPA
jgi:hypothetical protein